MKAVVQRVSRAEVRALGATVGAIGRGMVIFVCVVEGDTERCARSFAERIARFRFYEDDAGKMNLSALDTGASALVISQFTLAADGKKGRRPSFDKAASPEVARPLYEHFADCLGDLGLTVARGAFGEHMDVECVGDGPVTFSLEEI
ncbi:MAG: D-tyrosyl-tRNA(Tyr) deacylase [Bacteroidia bacterium]